MRKIVIVAAVAALTACATGPTPEELAAADQARCTEYGYPADHPDHGLCRLVLDQQRMQAEHAEAAQKAANAALLGAAAQSYGTFFPQPATPAAPAPAAPIRCYTYTGGWTCR